MNCPLDQTTLLITERHGIEIDYCPKCRGVWLDRGELDKILEQDSGQENPEAETPAPAPRKNGDDKQDYYTGDYHGDSYKKKRRKESFLSDLFDF